MTNEQPRKWTRRQVLVFSGAAVAVLTAAYAGLRQTGQYAPLQQSYRTIGPKEAAVFKVIGDFILPPGGPLPGSGGDDTTLLLIDEFIADMPPNKQILTTALPLLFEHGSGLDRFGSRSMTKLSDDRRDQYLVEWATSHNPLQGQIWGATRTLYALTYGERPDVLAAMNAAIECRS